MTDIHAPLADAGGMETLPMEPIRLPDEPASEVEPSASVIVVKRTTLYYGIVGFMVLLLTYLIGWTMGASSTAGTVQAVREAISTSLANASLNGSGNDLALQPSPAPTEDPNVRYAVDVTGSPALGPDNAPVTIIEFSDFECPYCERFFVQTEAVLLKKYEGKIRLVYRNFPLVSIHPNAMGAAIAAACAHEQGKFWEYHDLLFQNQDQLTKPDLIAHSKRLSLDTTVFQTCLDSSQSAQKVQNDMQAALDLHLGGTPAFFINGRKVMGAQPLTVLSAFIDAELAVSRSARTPTVTGR